VVVVAAAVDGSRVGSGGGVGVDGSSRHGGAGSSNSGTVAIVPEIVVVVVVVTNLFRITEFKYPPHTLVFKPTLT
jgi:hypothetical protein